MSLRKFTLQGALVACLLSMTATSCEKADEQDLKPLPYLSKSNVAAYPWYRLRFFNGVDWCYNWQGNCLGTVIVHGHQHRENLNAHFVQMTGNPTAVKEFFSGSEWPLYFPILTAPEAAPFLERLRSGECDIKRLEYEKGFYYAGAGELTADKNEMVLPVDYEANEN